jgi:hypothetical protein
VADGRHRYLGDLGELKLCQVGGAAPLGEFGRPSWVEGEGATSSGLSEVT